MQSTPLPLKPFLHLHLYDPCVLRHSAWWLHLWLPERHSSISKISAWNPFISLVMIISNWIPVVLFKVFPYLRSHIFHLHISGRTHSGICSSSCQMCWYTVGWKDKDSALSHTHQCLKERDKGHGYYVIVKTFMNIHYSECFFTLRDDGGRRWSYDSLVWPFPIVFTTLNGTIWF